MQKKEKKIVGKNKIIVKNLVESQLWEKKETMLYKKKQMETNFFKPF